MLKLDTSKGRAAIVTAAMTEVGAKVIEIGKDRGPKVEEYQKTVHLSPGSPWCAAFVVWCVRQGLQLPKNPKWAGGAAVGLYHNGSKALKKRGMEDYYAPALSGQDSKVKPGWVFSQGRDDAMAAKARTGVYTLGLYDSLEDTDTEYLFPFPILKVNPLLQSR